MVPIIKDLEEMRALSRKLRLDGKRIGFVPTMGALHEGHLSLVQHSKEQCDATIVSIYVNPTQFSKNEDFGVYPRTMESDVRKLESLNCTAVFAPKNLYHAPEKSEDNRSLVVGVCEDVDPESHSTWINVEYLSEGLCARSRPHFFRGVCTIVAKLFNIVDPDAAYFGKKDYQQWKVVCRMVRDLNFAIDVVGVPICREEDGLAMSSRNALLSLEERKAAVCIYRALVKAKKTIKDKESSGCQELKLQIASEIENSGGKMDYVEIRNADNLQTLEDFQIGNIPTVIAVAACFGKVRLIDNIDF